MMTFQPSPAYDTIFPKTKKPAEPEKLSSSGYGLFSGAGSCLSSGELLRRHAPMDLDGVPFSPHGLCSS